MHWLSYLGLMMLFALPAWAAEEKAVDPTDFDKYNAEDINMVCAACHGENGKGGKEGVYPRIAGLPYQYMVDQLKLFRTRTRVNIPMVPFTEERELPDEDIHDISAYFAQIKLSNRMPEMPEDTDAYVRLKTAENVVQIGLHKGDVKAGKALYRSECKLCHGKKGYGKKKIPQLAGQYTTYLKKQMKEVLEGKRQHEDGEILFGELSKEDIDNLMAFISTLDD